MQESNRHPSPLNERQHSEVAQPRGAAAAMRAQPHGAAAAPRGTPPRLTPRERTLRALRREGGLDRPPFEISWGAFTPGLMEVFRRQTGSVLAPDAYFDFDVRAVGPGRTRLQTDFRPYYQDPLPEGIFFNEWGVGSTRGSVAHFTEIRANPLANVEQADEVKAYAWPDLTAAYRYEGLAERVQDLHDRGYAVAGDLYCTIFEMAWQVRGMENLLTDFLLEPDMAHAVCDQIADLRVAQAQRLAGAGIDILRLGDDVCTQRGPMMSLELYRRYLKEPTRRVIEAARAVNPKILIFMHCDGQVGELIPEYIDIGINILNPIQPECNDQAQIAREFGDCLSFWGGVGTQQVMPFGSPQDVRAHVREVSQTLGARGNLLLAPTHILEPEVPWENVLAFVDEVRSLRA